MSAQPPIPGRARKTAPPQKEGGATQGGHKKSEKVAKVADKVNKSNQELNNQIDALLDGVLADEQPSQADQRSIEAGDVIGKLDSQVDDIIANLGKGKH